MSRPLANRCWTVAYFVSWVLAVGGSMGLVAAVAWGAYLGGLGSEDDVTLLGIPIGAGLGFLAARGTRHRRVLHRVLLVVGLVVAVLGAVLAVTMFAAAKAHRGEGWFAGLGEVIVGLFALVLAAIGVAWFAVGATGRLAARTAPSP